MLRCRYAHPGSRTDVPSPDVIRVGDVPAHTAYEFALALAVGFLAVAAFGTGSAGVPGIDHDHGDTCQLGLVLDEATQLEECPTGELVPSVSASSRYPIANTCQVFQADSAIGALGGCHDLLGDAVVLVLAEPGFLPLGPLHRTTDVLRPFALPTLRHRCPPKGRTSLAVVAAGGVDLPTGELLAVFGVGKVRGAEIHAHEVGRRDRRNRGDIDSDQQKPLAIVTEHEVSLALGVGELLCLVLAQHKRDDSPTGKREQAHAVDTLEAHGPLVIDDCGMLAELDLPGLIPLVRIAHALDRVLCHLARQPEPLSHLAVGKLADVELVGFLASEALSGDPVARFVEPFDRGTEALGLFGIGQQLYLDRELHGSSIVDSAQRLNGLKPREKAFPPLPFKRRGFHGLRPSCC